MLRKLLSSDGGIFFYTPVGLEIGFNYNGVNNQFGWMTATIKDYEDYLKKCKAAGDRPVPLWSVGDPLR